MQRIFIFISLSVFTSLVSPAQIRVSGFVRDAETGENLIGATILNKNGQYGKTTNKDGFFTLLLKKGDSLSISYVGYLSQEVPINNAANQPLEIKLKVDNRLLNEVTVSPIQQVSLSQLTLKPAELKAIPAPGAINDVVKAVQLLPGVTAQNEGSSQLIVRGGRPGENLYLVDNIPLIYVNHLGGFFSVFNSDIINQVDLHKDAFPARYGGRLSSVVAITQREGNNQQFKGKLTLSPLVSGMSVEGPFKSKKLTYIVSLRKTLIDALMMAGTTISPGNDFTFGYGFHDLNSKISYKPNAKQTYSFSLYQGDDYLNYWTRADFDETTSRGRRQTVWGNWMASLQAKNTFNDALTAESSLAFIRYRLKYKNTYDNDVSTDELTFDNRFSSILEEWRLQHEYHHFINNNVSLNYGVVGSFKDYTPNTIFSLERGFQTGETNHILEASTFAEADINFLKFSSLRLGSRLNYFKNRDYVQIQPAPRVALNIGLNRKNAFNLNYTVSNQFAHMLFTTGYVANNEIWVPAYEDAPFSRAVQYSAGYTTKQLFGTLNVELQAYQKYFENITIYRDGLRNVFGDTAWKNKIISGGDGESRGLELLLRKNQGSVTGFASYTISRTTYQFPTVNEGLPFVFEFDRTHNFSSFLSHQLTDNLSISASWTYQTGLPYTPASGKRLVPSTENPNEFKEVLIYDDRNSARMRAFHRLDLGLFYDKYTKKGRKAQWAFSIYNAYSRQNPYSYFYNNRPSFDFFRDDQPDIGQELKLYQQSFFPVIPSFSYSLFFGKGSKKVNPKNKISGAL